MKKIYLASLAFLLASSSWAALNESRYTQMKQNFLNVDAQYFSEIVFGDYFGDSSQDFPEMETRDQNGKRIDYGDNILEMTSSEGGFKGKYWFGGSYWCDNENGGKSICRYNTGGSPRNNTPVCGTSVNNSYQYALNCPSCICNPGNWAPSSGVRMWFGAGNNQTFILPGSFLNLENGPANRICWEVELPKDRFRADSVPQDLSVVVNHDVAHANLEGINFHIGTYTSAYKGEASTDDEERSGTFQGGGTHFYHNTSPPGIATRSYMDKAYALDEDTFVACIGDAPSGVRSGMRPPYYSNPFMTVVGENEDGLTDAYSYIPYLTRIYFEVHGSEMIYPNTIKFNRIFTLYEKNDVFAMSGKGAVLGVNMVEDGGTAEHPFTIYNDAAEDRTYKITMIAGGNVPLTSSYEKFKIFVDENRNRKKDPNETQELIPLQKITLQAKTDLHLVALHKPGWFSTQRYNRRFAHAKVTFQEEGRMRMAMYAIRTWEATAAELNQKNELLAQMVYPSPTSDYTTESHWNQDKPNNPRLVRNTPDFLMARQRYLNRTPDSTPPAAPQGLQGQVVSETQIDLSWQEAVENDGWVDHYELYRDGVKIKDLGGKFPATTFSDSGLIGNTLYTYQVRAVNGSGVASSLSAAINVTTPSDPNPPVVVSATVDIGTPKRLTVVYNEPLNRGTAENLTNYSLNVTGIQFLAATLEPDGRTLSIDTDLPLVSTPYTLTINNVQDASGNTIAANTQVNFSMPFLVDFGGTESESTFGLDGWISMIKDSYTDFRPIGPGGTTATIDHNGAYDYVGIRGQNRSFSAGDTIRVYFYNATSSPISFTPKITFNYQGRHTRGGTWYDMSPITIPGQSSEVSSYVFDAQSAGSHLLVSVANTYNSPGSNAGEQVITDKIELRVNPIPDTQPPTTPTNAQVTNVTNNHITLSWTASTDDRGLAGYRIEYDTNQNFSNGLSFSVNSNTTHTLPNLQPNTKYYLRIRAVDTGANVSGPTTILTVTTEDGPPPPPDDPDNPGDPDDPDNPDNPAPSPPSANEKYPNVFNPKAEKLTVGYTLNNPSRVVCTVYNKDGQRIKVVVDADKPAGGHTFEWDGRNEQGAAVVSGLYFIQMEMEGAITKKKIVLLK